MKRAWWLSVVPFLLLAFGVGSFLAAKGQSWKIFVDFDQVYRTEGLGRTLEPGHRVGQTFVARHGGLNGVEVYLSPTEGAQGELTLHLRESPTSAVDTLAMNLSLQPGSQEGFHRFSFPSIFASHTKYYYAVLEYQGLGQIEIPGGGLDSYLDGTLYYDDEPQGSQMVFRLTYDSVSIVLDLLLMAVVWIGYGLAGLAILFSSGYWLVRKWARNAGLDFTATLIAAAMAALAAWMVFLAWASLFLRLGTTSVRLIVFTGALIGLVQFARDRECWWKREYWLGDSPFSTLALWLVVILSIAMRLFVGRGMVMLPGSDTYHHTLIVQLFEEQGGIPRSYEPYAPLISYSYHYGFHSIVALFRWLFGTELLVTNKTVALVLNGAVAATVGLVTERWAGNRRAGVIAAAVVGLIAVSPYSLLCWGRFTQTTGLLFLGMGLLALTARREGAGRLFLSLIIAGMVLSHYRVAFLWLLFAILAGGANSLQRRWSEVGDWLVTAALSVVLTAPWLLRVAWVQYDPNGLRALAPVLEGVNNVQRLEAPVISFITNVPLLAASVILIGVVWSRTRNQSTGRLLVIWCFVLAGGALILSAWGVYFSFLDLNTTLLSMTVPIGILAGLSGEYLWNAFHSQRQFLARTGIALVLLGGMAFGFYHLPRLVRERSSFYLRPSDLKVMEWIENNIPEEALFLVNSTQFDWAPGWVVGIDTGYWIPLLAHRAATVPPMIYSLEWGDASELTPSLEASREFVSSYRDGTSSLGEILNRYGITHVFVSAQQQSLVLAELAQVANLRQIHHQDRAWILEVER